MTPTPEAVNAECLSALLDGAVINWVLDEANDIYVTGLQVPTWVEREGARRASPCAAISHCAARPTTWPRCALPTIAVPA